MQSVEFEGFGYLLIRQVADQCSNQIAPLLEFQLQRRQSGFRLRKRPFLCSDIDSHGVPQPELIAQDAERFFVRSDDLLCGMDLRPQRCLLDGSGSHIRGEGDVSCFEGKALCLRLRGQRFHLPPVAAEYVGHESHGEFRRLKIVVQRRRVWVNARLQGCGEVVAVALNAGSLVVGEVAGYLVPLRLVGCADRRVEGAFLRETARNVVFLSCIKIGD